MPIRAFAVLAAALLLRAGPSIAADRAGARRLYEEARGHYLAGEFRDALRSANESIAGDSRSGPAFALRARLWRILGNPEHEKDDGARALR